MLQEKELPALNKELEKAKDDEGFGKKQFPESEVKDFGVLGKKKRTQPENCEDASREAKLFRAGEDPETRKD